MLLDCLQIDPPGVSSDQPAQATVIWLHGLGADGHDFEPIVPSLELPPENPVRFVFPHAPTRPVTINNGYVMRAWFDITSLERLDGADRAGVEASVADIHTLIERETARGVDASRIVLAGFSQGGVIALHAAARYPETLAGIIALSTYLPFHETLGEQASGANRDTPVFMAHGRYDPVLPFALGRMAHEAAQPLFGEILWKEYPMEHAVCLEEIGDIGGWLRRLPVLQPPS